MSTSTQSTPTLHVEHSRTARAFPPGESLWHRELSQIYELVDKHVRALKRSRDNSSENGTERLPVLSIAIFGGNGSGKTSLLKTLVSEVNHKRASKHPGLHSLPVIEPNLARDQHFLYAFLATALEEDLHHHTNRPRQQTHALTPVQQAFQEVSEYLQVIDEMGKPEEYDPLGLSLERLERHTSGLLLRDRLRNLLDRLANDLAGSDTESVVLLPVDDADMSLDSLVSTLDTFHRYLQHPRLVPVFTFTGRLAEELLRVHFAKNLTMVESRRISEELAQKSATLEMVEKLAVQYLVKLFPIRNRIRLGPAPARVQGGFYHLYRNGAERIRGEENGEKRVWDLLETASTLLFGCPEWPIVPRVRLALRPTSLRRQLQVLDAMIDSRVNEFVQGAQVEEKLFWPLVFNDAAWALLNVHRDVLRDYQMHIEELYSLTPWSLSRHLLRAVLDLGSETRRELLHRWRFQTENRRGQVLSLLALNAFRPHMQEEEDSGDDPDAIRARWTAPEERTKEENKDPLSFFATKGILWFLDLWMDFYLPQILARNRRSTTTKEGPELGSIHGVGWTLRSGAVNAAREALTNQEISATGMMFLDPVDFSAQLEDAAPESRLALQLWCFYGYQKGDPWVAVSFWRGLGLVGQILEDFERMQFETDQINRVIALIEKHCAAAQVPGSYQRGKLSLGRWDSKLHKREIRALARSFTDWIETHKEMRISPMKREADEGASGGEPAKTGDEEETVNRFQREFRRSFIRRLHGEYLVGDFWPQLGGAYMEGPVEPPPEPLEPSEKAKDDEPWVARAALQRWTSVLLKYWEEDRTQRGAIFEILRSCPLLWPFAQERDAPSPEKPWIEPENLKVFDHLKRTARLPGQEKEEPKGAKKKVKKTARLEGDDGGAK